LLAQQGCSWCEGQPKNTELKGENSMTAGRQNVKTWHASRRIDYQLSRRSNGMNSSKVRVRLFVIVAVLTAAISVIGGCNTVEGVGKDLSGAGQGLADIAADINPENN
jgi:predicted small secreted protein